VTSEAGGKVTYDPDGKLKLMLSDRHKISQISKVAQDPVDVNGLIGVTEMVEKTMISINIIILKSLPDRKSRVVRECSKSLPTVSDLFPLEVMRYGQVLSKTVPTF
jgi:hypothetical protein